MSFESDTDTRIATLMSDLDGAKRRLEWEENSLRRSAGQYGKGTRFGYEWDGTLSEALASGRPANIVSYCEAQRVVEAARETLRSVTALYTGWSRFYLVANTNGHIHRDMSCTTCYATTAYRWVTSLSGQTEAEAVAELGEILCSVCFPSAPVAWTMGESKATVEARAERAAKKAVADAKKAEKALLPDAEYLEFRDHNGYRERIATLASAKQFLTGVAEARRFGYREDTVAEALVAEAVAAKTGETVAEVLAAAAKRAAKR